MCPYDFRERFVGVRGGGGGGSDLQIQVLFVVPA